MDAYKEIETSTEGFVKIALEVVALALVVAVVVVLMLAIAGPVK